jgi:outer membrane protein assembly factor BamB
MRCIIGFAAAILITVHLFAAERDNYWPQWRGPEATGVSRTADPPIEWSETKNIKWKVEIPGRGSSSPVAWGDRL